MDDLLEGFGNGSAQDNFDLAALQFFAELDRHAGREEAPGPAPREDPTAWKRTAQGPEEEGMPDLHNIGEDSIVLQMMSEPGPEKAPPRPAPRGKLSRPVPRKRMEPGSPAGRLQEEKPLSDLAQSAAQLFDSLPTEDQLLAYTLLQKLSKAAEG